MSDIFRDHSFGGQLAFLRKQNCVTLRETCREAELDVGNYSKVERSELPPPNSKDKCIELFEKLQIDEKHRDWLLSLALSFHLGRIQGRFMP